MISRGAAWDAFSLYVRVRDAAPFTGIVTCCTCGRAKHYKEVDAGHFIPWNKGNATKYHEQNVHGQCKACNGFEQGSQSAYSKFLDKKYGPGTADRLMILSKQTRKLWPFELEALKKHWKAEARKIILEKKI